MTWMVPAMPAPPGPPWMLQKYGNALPESAAVKVCTKVKGGLWTPESQTPVSEVVEWSAPVQFHVTVSPAMTIRFFGANSKSFMVTVGPLGAVPVGHGRPTG